jgi:hypothetical protein
MIKNIFKLSIYSIVLISICLSFSSCEEDTIGSPVIEYVRKTDPAFADSTFTSAFPSTMIAIIGKNLQNTKHIFINDQEISFNCNYNTSTSLIVSIPSEEDGFELTAVNPLLKGEIRIETGGGVARYNFHIYFDAPTINRISGEYPRKTGDKLMVYGQNFVEINKVYFTNVNPDTNIVVPDEEIVEVTDYTVTNNRYLDDKETWVTDSEMEITLPGLSFNNGYLVIDCITAKASIEFAAKPPKPVIKSLSSDMPIAGTKVSIYGNYFVAVESVNICDEITIAAENLVVSSSEDTITFTMPSKPSKSGKILVTTAGGEVSTDFYQFDNLLIDFDTRGKDLTWSPNATYLTATSSEIPYLSDGMYALFNKVGVGQTWWDIMVYWSYNEAQDPFVLPSYNKIPASTPTSKIYLAYECYNTIPFNSTCFIHYRMEGTNVSEMLYENFSWTTNMPIDVVLPNIEGKAFINQWYRVMVPMNKFSAFDGKTYEDIVNAGIKTIRLMLLNWGSQSQDVNLCVDNIRLVVIE